jgi:hypothetical protein
MEKDKEWKERLALVEGQHAKEVEGYQRVIDAGEREKTSIKKNYDSQIKMLTEHLADL